MKKSVLLHSLNENKGVGKEAIFESNSIKLFVEKYKEDIKPYRARCPGVNIYRQYNIRPKDIR